MLHLSVLRHRNNFHIFLSLTVNFDSAKHSKKLNALKGTFDYKEWDFHIHVEILNLNSKERRQYSQDSSMGQWPID